MTIPKYILLSIINTITTILPISNTAHINFLKNIFETNIFNHQTSFYITINIGIIFSIIYILTKLIYIDKNILSKSNIKKIKIFTYTTITSLIPITLYYILYKHTSHLQSQFFIKKLTPIFCIINAFILLIANKNINKEKNIKLSNLIFINIINSLTIIPGISNISLTLLTTKLLKYSKRQSIIITLLTTLFYAIYLFNPQITQLTYPIYSYIISIITTLIISKIFINYLIRLYSNNKLSKISIYLIFLSIFILYWFR